MNKTAAVVVTYNRWKLLLRCLDALLASETPTDIVLVDNASTDETAEVVKPYLENPQLHYFRMEENGGGAGGFNYGMRKACEMGYEYIWLMDDDTIVEKDSLTHLCKAAQETPEFGFLSSIAYWRDGSLCNMNRQHTSLRGRLELTDEPLIPVTKATFVSFFVSAKTVREVGLPIRDFFIWADDLEYSGRISAGKPCYAVTASRVLHDMGSNQKVGIEKESSDRLWRYEYLYRNEVYVYRREGAKGWMFLYARLALHICRILFKAKEAKGTKLRVVLKSFRRGYSFRPDVERVE